MAQTDQADSLRSVLSKHKDDTTRVLTLIELYKLEFSARPDSAFPLVTEAAALSEKLHYVKGRMMTTYYKGFFEFSIRANYTLGFRHYVEALKLAEQTGDLFYQAKLQANIAYMFDEQGKPEESVKRYYKAISLYRSLGKERAAVLLYSNLVTPLLHLDKTRLADSLMRSGLHFGEQIKDEYVVGRMSLSLSEVLAQERKTEEAIHFSKQATDIFYQRKDYRDFAYCLNLLATQHLQTNHTREAKHFADSALAVCKLHNLRVEKLGSYEALEKIHVQLKDFKGAYQYKSDLGSLKDSILNQSKSADITNIENRYRQDKIDATELANRERQKLIRNGFIAGFLVMVVFAAVVYLQRNRTRKEKQRSDELLLNILPAEVAEELKQNGHAAARQYNEVTVMFADFKGFTRIAEKLSPTELVQEIHDCFTAYDHIISRYGIEKIKTIGDSYMCASGLPHPSETHAEDMVRASLEIQQFTMERLQRLRAEGKDSFEVRIGIHTGPVVAGIVGVKKFAWDIWGDAVNTASRMESSGEAGKVNISGTVYERIKDKFNCTARGKIEAKNKGEIEMYFVEGQ